MALTEKARKKMMDIFDVDPAKIHPEDPEMVEILGNEVFDEISSSGVIDDKKRQMITITVCTSIQMLDQLRGHVASALRLGATALEIRETIYQCAPYIGFPKTMNALTAANAVFKEKGYTLPLERAGTTAYEDSQEAGAAIQLPRYGDEVKTVFAKLPGEFGTLVPHLLTSVAFGEFSTRGVLNDAEKELTALLALVCIGASQQLKPHIASALKAGNTLEEITAAVVQTLPYIGFPYALSALALIANYEEGNTEAYR